MRKQKMITGVMLSKSLKQKQEIASALTWLDIKVMEFIDREGSDNKFCSSLKCTMEYSEILGVLKFLYMAEIITVEEFNLIVKQINGGDDIDEEDLD